MKKPKIESLFDIFSSSIHSQRTVLRMFESLTGKPTRKHEGLLKTASKGIMLGGAIRTILRVFRSK